MSSIAGGVCIACACFLASAGGIGGGGVLVALGLVIFGWSYDRAVVLALVAVFGNLLAQLALNYRKRHMTLRSRPLIYWDGVLLLCPAMLGGSSIGKIVAKILPDTIKKSFAIIVLAAVTIKTFVKALILYRAEVRDTMASSLEKGEEDCKRIGTLATQLMDKNGSSSSNNTSSNSTNFPQDMHEERISIAKMSFDGEGDVFTDYEEETHVEAEVKVKIQYPYDIMRVIFIVWLLYAAIFIITAAVTEKCTAVYWVLTCVIFIPLLIITYWGIQDVKRRQLSIDNYMLKGDLDITKGFPATVPIIAFVIGIMCNILGIGGGELMGPLLLFLHIEPQVTSATSSFLSFLSSSSNVLHYGVDNEIPLGVAAWIFPVGFVAGMCGRYSAIYITKKYERPSVTVFALAGILFISTCLILYDLCISEVDMSVGNICSD